MFRARWLWSLTCTGLGTSEPISPPTCICHWRRDGFRLHSISCLIPRNRHSIARDPSILGQGCSPAFHTGCWALGAVFSLPSGQDTMQQDMDDCFSQYSRRFEEQKGAALMYDEQGGWGMKVHLCLPWKPWKCCHEFYGSSLLEALVPTKQIGIWIFFPIRWPGKKDCRRIFNLVWVRKAPISLLVLCMYVALATQSYRFASYWIVAGQATYISTPSRGWLRLQLI